jgi:hypothetical protein
VGRPYDAIEKTTLNTLRITRDGRDGSLTPSAAIEYFAHQADLGVDQAIFNSPMVAEPEFFDILATEVIPEVSKIAVAGRAEKSTQEVA